MMTTKHTDTQARAGDWIEVNGLPGRSSRSGEILEVLGHDSHEHYVVRWDEQHQSILFPTEGAAVIRHTRAPTGTAASVASRASTPPVR